MSVILCSICGGDTRPWLLAADYQLENEDRRYAYYACEHCSLGFLSPQPPVEAYEKLYTDAYISHKEQSAESPQPRTGFRRLVDQCRASLMASRLPELFPAVSRNKFIHVFLSLFQYMSACRATPFYFPVTNKKVLDIGCGTGKFLGMMKRYGWQSFGIEPSSSAAEKAASQGARVKVGFFAASHFSHEQFDLITAHHVVEHVHDPESVLHDIKQLLRPHGCAYIQVPHKYSVMAWLWKRYWFNLDAPRHLFLFTRESLEQLAQRAGLQIIVSYTQSSTDGFLGSFSYWLRYRWKKKHAPVNTIRRNKFLSLLCKPFIILLDRLGLGDTIHFIVRRI